MRHETVTVDVGGLNQVLDGALVEAQLKKLPGVHEARVGFTSGTATVTFDPARTSLREIEAQIRACGYHCGGEVLPAHLCVTAPAAEARVGERSLEPPGHGAMAHEMGHGAAMDAHAMARDMRNRFWVAFLFAAPIFLLSAMSSP